jgi:radical SAM protein with 4Fe4S-binding SPASM domain
MLQEDLFKKVIDQQKSTLANLTFYFQGEPYLHPKFLEMVRYASDRHIYTSTSTNAHYLSDENAKKTIESGLSQMIISLDGTTQETYASYRIGGKIEKVIEGAKNIMRLKKEMNSHTPKVILQFLVVRPNEHQIEDVKKLAEEIGVDELTLKTAQIYDYKDGSDLIPSLDHYSRYRRNKDGSYSIKNEMENHCWKMWHSCVITWDGKVIPCCFDKDAHHQMGDVSKFELKKIWKSPAYHQFRKSILKSRSEIEMCQNCTEGMRIWA